VRANHEKRVAQHLSARSLEHFLPLYTEHSQWTDRTVTLEHPLFTGYVFVRFSPGARLSLIATPGVIRLLGKSDTVSNEEIDRIRGGLAGGYLLRPHPRIVAGTKVRVRNGFFAGAEGMVSALHHHCRVVILLSAVQQCFSLEVKLDDLEILNEAIVSPALERTASKGAWC
jgi:transcription antitermination factor NusG